MKQAQRFGLRAVAAIGVMGCLAVGMLRLRADSGQVTVVVFPDSTGTVSTISTLPMIDPANPFFQSIGTNGRACVTCHAPGDAWGVSAQHIRQRFVASLGADPIFRPVDGTVCANADTSTLGAKVHAYSLLLNKGLIRIAMPMPANAEFSVQSVDDPYGCAYQDGVVSVYRRPLPAANLRFDTAVMWDGRETRGNIVDSLSSQARDATMGHAQGSMPSDSVVQQIVDLELSFHTAQASDFLAGPLSQNGGNGGPAGLVSQPFYAGINDVLGADPTGAAFSAKIFSAYDSWAGLTEHDAVSARRASIARGQAIFDSRTFMIDGVGGLNDKLGVAEITGTCGTCHDTPNVGNHSTKLPINIGLVSAANRTPDLPLFTLRNNATGETVQVTDPGLALLTGKWADIGKMKGAILRALPARAPYFHNGSAATLEDVVNFYDNRFHIGLSRQDKADLVAFLSSL